MKSKKQILFLLFIIIIITVNDSKCQNIGNLENSQFIKDRTIVNNQTLTSQWNENNELWHRWNIGVGPGDLPPDEFGFLLGQDRFVFNTYPNYFQEFYVRYDGGNYLKIAEENYFTDDIIPPWTSTGNHTMGIKYYNVGGVSIEYEFTINVVPERNKLYYDGTVIPLKVKR